LGERLCQNAVAYDSNRVIPAKNTIGIVCHKILMQLVSALVNIHIDCNSAGFGYNLILV